MNVITYGLNYGVLLINSWPSLVGMLALIVALINILKSIGVIKDGHRICGALGLTAWLPYLVCHRLVSPYDVASVDTALGQAAFVLTFITTYVIQLGGAKLVYKALKGLPYIGKSFSS